MAADGRERWKGGARILRALEPVGALLFLVAALLALGDTPAWVRGYVGNRDAGFHLQLLDHYQQVLLGEAAHWRRTPLAYPLPSSVTQGDWVLGEALISLPWRLAGVDPWLFHDVAIVFGLLGTGFAVYLLTRAWLGRGLHAWVAGFLALSSPFALAHLPHLNLVQLHLPVLAALALGAGLERDRPGLTALGGALVGIGFHFGAYVGGQGLAVAFAVLVGAGLAGRGSRRTRAAALAGLTLSMLTVVPVAAAYLQDARRYAIGTGTFDAGAESLDLLALLTPPDRTVWDPLRRALPWIEPGPETATPGLLTLTLGAIGAVLWWRRGAGPAWARRTLLAVTLGAFVLALGAELRVGGVETGIPLPYRALSWLTGEGLRAPGRWIGLAFLGLSVAAAFGVREAARRSRVLGAVVAVAAVVGVRLERASTPRGDGAPLVLPAVYGALDRVEVPGAILEVNGEVPDRERWNGHRCGCTAVHTSRAALAHGRFVARAGYARPVPVLSGILGAVARAPGWADDLGIAVILVHPPLEGWTEVEGLSCEPFDEHLLCTPDGPVGPPIPRGEDLLLEGEGPVVAARWPDGLPDDDVRFTCDGETTTRDGAVWTALQRVMHGEGHTAVDVVLPEPCAGSLQIAPDGAVPLFAAGGALDAHPAPRPVSGLQLRSVGYRDAVPGQRPPSGRPPAAPVAEAPPDKLPPGALLGTAPPAEGLGQPDPGEAGPVRPWDGPEEPPPPPKPGQGRPR